MAKVYLRSDYGHEIVDLPPVCMACGAPATVRKRKLFSWQPQWVPVLILVGVLPYVIVSLVLTKRQRVATPLCERHASYWWLFPTLLTLSFFALFGVGFALFIALTVAEQNQPRGGGGVAGFACLATVLAFLVWLIVAVVLQNRRIRPAEITDRHIELIKVSEAFADAVEEEEERDRGRFGREFDEGPRRRFREDEPRPRRDLDDDRYREDDERRYQP
jgi:hypothetical protein